MLDIGMRLLPAPGAERPGHQFLKLPRRQGRDSLHQVAEGAGRVLRLCCGGHLVFSTVNGREYVGRQHSKQSVPTHFADMAFFFGGELEARFAALCWADITPAP